MCTKGYSKTLPDTAADRAERPTNGHRHGLKGAGFKLWKVCRTYLLIVAGPAVGNLRLQRHKQVQDTWHRDCRYQTALAKT
jgi:hypothetical protein